MAGRAFSSDVRLAKIEEKAKFSGWDREESCKIILSLIEEIRFLKEMMHNANSKGFMEALDAEIDKHEMVIVEIETLQAIFARSNGEITLESFVDDVSKRANWKAAINHRENTVMFYKHRDEMTPSGEVASEPDVLS